MNAALAAAATLVASAFALSTLDRWLRRRRPHDLAWTVSLALFAFGAGALWWAESVGWGLGVFRVFYLAGAILNVPWLALGTVYLLADRLPFGKRFADRVRGWLILISGFAVGVVLFAPTRATVTGDELPTGKEVFGVAPRVLAAVGSGLAALIIVAGAVWSVWRPRRGGSRLTIGNVLIAAGTLVLSASGTLAGRLGKDRAFAVTLLIGICVLFAGFLVATSTRPVRALDQTPTQELAADVAR
ncbi:MAG: hypothetical protein K8R99_02280 [Actinomycetia bacterium]|nr:hypothetical protein [Actinomycetes bacterium]